MGRDQDVMPGFSEGKQDNHGTSCAGAIAMVKDNGVFGVGVAYDSKIAGLQQLYGHFIFTKLHMYTNLDV